MRSAVNYLVRFLFSTALLKWMFERVISDPQLLVPVGVTIVLLWYFPKGDIFRVYLSWYLSSLMPWCTLILNLTLAGVLGGGLTFTFLVAVVNFFPLEYLTSWQVPFGGVLEGLSIWWSELWGYYPFTNYWRSYRVHLWLIWPVQSWFKLDFIQVVIIGEVYKFGGQDCLSTDLLVGYYR
jgi:hypothetical protein